MKAHFPLRRSRRQNAFAPLRLLGRDADRHRTRYLLALSFLASLATERAHAANACGPASAAPHYLVQCNDITLNPYASGISYNMAEGLDLRIGPGTTIVPAPDTLIYGVAASTSGTQDISVTLARGARIRTEGMDAAGILATGAGNVSVVSAGAIVTRDATPPTFDSSGPYGIVADSDGDAGSLRIRLLTTASVLTDGEAGAAVYAINDSTGAATVDVSGSIETLGLNSDGVLLFNRNNANNAPASVTLSPLARVRTRANQSNGAWILNYGTGTTFLASSGVVQTSGDSSNGFHLQASAGNASVMHLELGNGARVITEGDTAVGVALSHEGTGDIRVHLDRDTALLTSGMLSHGLNAEGNGAVLLSQRADSTVTTSGAQAIGVLLIGGPSVNAAVGGTVRAQGRHATGVALLARAGGVHLAVAPGASIEGGWQADVAGRDAPLGQPSAGVILGGATASTLENAGAIGAQSDRAIFDEGRIDGKAGYLSVLNMGRLTGFVELAADGSNRFINAPGGVWEVRHFADTDGNGVRDTHRVAISDFGAPTSRFDNAPGATVRLAPVAPALVKDTAGYYVPGSQPAAARVDTPQPPSVRPGVAQGQFVNLGAFVHAGVLDLRGATAGNSLVMTSRPTANGPAGTGMFVSEGGTLLVNAAFGAEGSTGIADVLAVDGTRRGQAATTIVVDRREGPGMATADNGILVVDVRNPAASDANAFTLQGDYVREGRPFIIRGARAYGLYFNGVGQADRDGRWYLRDTAVAPTVPVYSSYPLALQALIDLPTLRQRASQGGAPWPDAANSAARPDFNSHPTANGSVWMRTKAGHARQQLDLSNGKATADADLYVLQVGRDWTLSSTPRNVVQGGLNLQYGHVSSQVRSPEGSGRVRASGYGAGATLTWYSARGFYTDLQAQLVRTEGDIHSATTGSPLIKNNRGLGHAASIEAGMPLALTPHWRITPQAQLLYSKIRFDPFTDPYGARVASTQGKDTRLRLGLDLAYRPDGSDTHSPQRGLAYHGGLNLYQTLRGSKTVGITNEQFSSAVERTLAGLDIGVHYTRDDRISAYAEISAQTGLDRPGANYALSGRLGLRMLW